MCGAGLVAVCCWSILPRATLLKGRVRIQVIYSALALTFLGFTGSLIAVRRGGIGGALQKLVQIMRQKKFVQSRGDDFTNYRELCEARLKRLERYKKTRSFCSLEMNEASTSTTNNNDCHQNKEDETSANLAKFSLPQHRTPYDLLREKMISLMETDNQLFENLLTLGETINELKKQPTIQRSTSETSLSSGNCEDEENEDELRPMKDKFSSSMSAITNLYLNGEHEEDEIENLPNFQYFSRKNSVLRIPIPARASNRILGKKIPRRPSELMRPRFTQKSTRNETNDSIQKIENDQQEVEEKLCQLLQVDNNQTSQNSPISSQHSPDNQSTLSSCCENERIATSASSIDSGIRDDDESSSSPLNDHSEAVENKQIVDV